MRQYELAIRIAQIHHLVDERKYKKALAVIQTLDMRQVRSYSDLKVCAEVYTKTEQFEAAKATYLRVYRHSRTRRVLYRLIYLSIRTNALDEAEAYFKEFVRMNPNARDVLILRYRLDKAAGVPIGQLIETLQELKNEEYIEEWAYELAKLYHRAGRRQECLEECEDILLWFGTGEIVERAKILIDHLKDKDPAPYYDDKDFTVQGEEEPNPDDTGSLPDIKSFIKERKAQKAEERPAEREDKWEKPDSDDFIDDYDDDDSLQDGMDLSQMAKGGIQRLSGFLRHGKRDEEKAAKKASEEPEQGIVEKLEKSLEKNLEKKSLEGLENRQEKQAAVKTEGVPADRAAGEREESPASGELKKSAENGRDRSIESRAESKPETVRESKPANQPQGYVPLSQSGTGITQDLAREISAIYDMEHREQLKEKEVKVVNDKANIATNVVERMTQAIQKSANRGYIPLDVEEIQVGKSAEAGLSEPEGRKNDLAGETVKPEVEEVEETAESWEPETDEAEETAESRELEADEAEETAESWEPETDEVGEAAEVWGSKADLQEEPWEPEADMAEEAKEEPWEPEVDAAEEAEKESWEPGVNAAEETGELSESDVTEESGGRQETDVAEEITEGQEEAEELEAGAAQSEATTEDVLTQALDAELEQYYREKEISGTESGQYQDGEMNEPVTVETQKSETEILRDLLEEEIEDPVMETEQPVRREVTSEEAQLQEELPEPDSGHVEALEPEEMLESAEEPRISPLEDYHAPEIPVVQTSYMEMPEIAFEDLPTTRALQQSFKNVLRLIEGELDPSHFVLMGDGTDRIVGVSKQIVRIMKETGYLSQGRIAKINANQLNKMDLITFREQLRGNCLLIENAADLLFPTITKIFSIMEEYYGDFVVILADEGTTLDQLFRFVPVLAKKFKYIIDISKYTKEDYEGK